MQAANTLQTINASENRILNRCISVYDATRLHFGFEMFRSGALGSYVIRALEQSSGFISMLQKNPENKSVRDHQ
jgi:hypothetical protein